MLRDEYIRSLCTQLLNATTDGDSLALAAQLRSALHEHVETIRGNLLLSIAPETPDVSAIRASDEAS